MTKEQLKITKQDQLKSFWRSNWEQGSWNFERMQNLGFTYAFIPIIKRLYPDRNDRKAALKRHLQFFNTMPIMHSLINGVVMALEEQRASGEEISDEIITDYKTAMMGPLGGLGDPLWWGTLRPLLAAIFSSVALSEFGLLGPILFFVVWNGMRLFARWKLQILGYERGLKVIELFQNDAIPKITKAFSIFGMFMLGGMVPKWVHVNIVTQIPQSLLMTDKALTIQDLFDYLLPGALPLLLTLYCVRLINKRVTPIKLILLLLIIGTLGYELNTLR